MSGWGGGGGSFGGGASGGGGSFAGGALAWDPSVTGMACAQLREARLRAEDAVRALRAAPDLAVAAAPGVNAAGLRWCGAELDARAAAAQALVGELDLLHDHTMLAGQSYEWASDAVRGLIERVAGTVAYALGTAVRTAALAAAPWAVAIGLVAVPLAAKLLLMHPELLASLTQRAQAAGTNLGRFLEDTSAFWERAGEVLMANPAFTGALALAVESTDEALAGLLGIPLPLANSVESRIGDDEVLGLLALSAAGGAGLLTGGGRVQAVFSRPVSPPSRPVTEPAEAMRIILDQDEQVTIAEFTMPDGSTRYQVFVRGTETIAPSGSSGLDMRANLENTGAAGEQLRGSDAAVAEAMREAGIEPGDAVDLFGFSQGAGAVANVAASGEFRVENALLVGGPVGAAEIPPEVAVLSVAHEGDIVPALDGWADGDGVQTTVVESAGGHGTGPLARHSGEEYLDTFEGIDDFAVDRWTQRMAALTAGGEPVSAVGVQLRRR
ncbi:hypothetical protein [Agrococcus sp. KRD186]|uniref:hypothetical protein n=1 Tax=Agrococcus sp. KRD186 TaxID=2729730 RepID=UPI0019D2D9B6|nr:hypothetical protein [Agrococcus sp. KRD186]